MPRRGNTSEEKRHMKTVPVKILKPEASLRKRNVDRGFAKSFIDDMFEVANIFGPLATLFLSNDDKARVPLGLAAASLQALILMFMASVRLPRKTRLATQGVHLFGFEVGNMTLHLHQHMHIIRTS